MARSNLRGSEPYGETWVYESIVGAIPGVELSDRQAIAVQLGIFQTGIVVLALVYDLWDAVLPGTVAVVVAAAGSGVMRQFGRRTRELDLPEPYRRLLFGSSIEVVLGILAFVALVTHLFIFDPRTADPTLLTGLFGPDPPVPVVYLTLLILWDLCYRIGTSWWGAVVALWRSWRYAFDPATARRLRRLDALNVGFGLTQLAMVPFLLDRPVLLVAVGGHIVAVTVVSVAAMATLRIR
ncbi:DUF7530 family protein [Halobellus clavatus]|jgi:hypothetical protein|uniref:Uncharacterized protein n=1 Tax=Halobellus clavatus TaxID=660517 RepID=A0A1H3ECR7_9EURY|nr:hypothetical protein [Halobellus clavatus]SDX76552.1 hypothetical protein SAMN04487946_102195 [Halobellus clavatus]